MNETEIGGGYGWRKGVRLAKQAEHIEEIKTIYTQPRVWGTKSVVGKSAFDTTIQRYFLPERVFLLVARRATSQTQV